MPGVWRHGASISTGQQGSPCVTMEPGTRDPAFLSQQRAAEDRTRARLPLAVPVVPGMSRPPPPRDRKVAPCVLGSATKSTARYARAKPEACDRARSVATPRVLLRHGDGLPGAMSVVSWCVSWHVCGAVHASVSMFAISYTCRYLSNPLIPSNSVNQNQSVLLHN